MRKRVSSADCVRRCARTCLPWSQGSPPGPSAARCRRSAVWRPRRRQTAARWEPSRCGKAGGMRGVARRRICPVGAGDSAGPFLLPVPGGQGRPPLRNCWGILCGASGTPPPTECAAGGVGAKKPDADASGFLIHSLLRIRLFGSLPSLTCPWGRRSGGRSCCRTRCRRRSRSWRRRISPQARPPGRSLSSWRPPDGRSSPWRR